MLVQDDDSERSAHFRQLKWSLQALAMPASTQLKLFPEFVVKADELALDFDSAWSAVRTNYEDELSPAQAAAIDAVERKLERMSRDGAEFDVDLWTESALSSSGQWEDVRSLAESALEAFGWTRESPPPDPADRGVVYVPAAPPQDL
jgi:hypothetical protein